MGASSVAIGRSSPQRLMAGVGAGNNEAIQHLIADYRERVFSYLYGWLGNREDALDVTQEVLIRVCQKAHYYDGSYPLTPWIYRIASNLCTDHFRKKNFRLHANSVEWDENLLSRAASELTPEEQTMHSEIIARVKEALQGLPPRQREVLELRLLRDYRLQEIADLRGIPLGTVKSTIHAAMKRLRGKLADLDA